MDNQPCAEDPRVRRTRALVHEATLDLLADVGFEGISIDCVAQRAGVARTTIYRNWSNKAELVIDAFGSMSPTLEIEPSGDTRADLLGLMKQLAAELPEARWASVLASLVAAAEHDPQLAAEKKKLIAERKRPLRLILQQAVESDLLSPTADPELIMSMLGGPLFYRRLVTGEPLDDAFVTHVVDSVLTAFATK